MVFLMKEIAFELDQRAASTRCGGRQPPQKHVLRPPLHEDLYTIDERTPVFLVLPMHKARLTGRAGFRTLATLRVFFSPSSVPSVVVEDDRTLQGTAPDVLGSPAVFRA